MRLRADCRFLDSFDELAELLPTLTRCDALVLSPRDARGRDALSTVEAIARDWAGTAIVIFVPAQATGFSPRAFLLAGAHDFVFEGVHDTAATLAQKVEDARRERAAETVFLRMQSLVPPALHTMAQMILARVDVLTTVAAVAEGLGVHRKTLVNRCTRAAFLDPGEIIVWCRLAMVGHLLERTGSTVERIGLNLGFPSHTALRNLIKRHIGVRALDIRRHGGLNVVLAAFARRIRAHSPTELPIQ
jgi:AraC-like DNA-binding protein